MDDYKFVGVRTTIGDVTLDEMGARIMLSKDEARNAVDGGAAIVPADKFEAVGFTPDELERYKYTGSRSSAPDSFHAKLRAAVSQIGVAEEQAGE